MTLAENDRGPAVETLQRRLRNAGHDIATDGIYGPATERAVRAYQRSRGLVADGIAGPRTLAALEGRPVPAPLAQSDLEAAAERLGVELAAIMAVNEVESRGEGFLPSGEPTILYERHIMYRCLEAAGHDADALARQHPALVNPDPGGYRGGGAEHVRLTAARRIDATCALQSASWGRFQIMGFHWERLGYDSVQAYTSAMRDSESAQLDAFVRFIETDRTLRESLRDRDWARLAETYNGPAYERNDYDTKLAGAYRRHARALAESEAADTPEPKRRKRRRSAKA